MVLPAAPNSGLRLGAHHGRGDALLAQFGLTRLAFLARFLALHLDAALVGAFPGELFQRGFRYGGSSVVLRQRCVGGHVLVLGHAVDFGQAGDTLL